MLIWGWIMALATVGQLVVITIAAVFAYGQVLGLRNQQEAQLIQAIYGNLNSPELAGALDFVYNELPQKLTEPAYVREIAEGRATAATHRELVAMHFFNSLGLLIHSRLVREPLVVPFVASPCVRAWGRLAPVVELLRRRYPHAYTPFEALVVRSRAVDLSKVNARFQDETPHLRAGWERTSRDLVEGRISLVDPKAVDASAPKL